MNHFYYFCIKETGCKENGFRGNAGLLIFIDERSGQGSELATLG